VGCGGAVGFTDVVDGDVAEEALVREPAEDDHLGLADRDRRVPAAGRRVNFQGGVQGERSATARRIGRIGGFTCEGLGVGPRSRRRRLSPSASASAASSLSSHSRRCDPRRSPERGSCCCGVLDGSRPLRSLVLTVGPGNVT
jgi:hypothetical protein